MNNEKDIELIILALIAGGKTPDEVSMKTGIPIMVVEQIIRADIERRSKNE
jgi:hypothetical protein